MPAPSSSPARKLVDFEYRLENNRYALYRQGVRQFDTDEVALLFDAEQHTLFRHGKPAELQAQYARLLKNQRGDPRLRPAAERTTLIQGRFDLAELNKVLRTPGYLREFIANHEMQFVLDAQSVVDRIRRKQ